MSSKEQVAVVTGGNSGIGLAATEAFVARGARVAVFGRNAESLQAVKDRFGEQVVTVRGDVTSREDLARLFEETVDAFGRVDAVFANAGIVEFAELGEADEVHFDKQFDINVKGAFLTAQAALPHLGEGGSILFTASVVDEKGLPGASVYSATKAAVRSLARTLAAELGPKGIRVNAISPGLTETSLLERGGVPAEATHGFAEQVASQTPLGRLAKPSEIAEAVVFLSSPAASYVNGAEIPVDGGFAQV